MIAKAVYDACAGEDGLIDDPGNASSSRGACMCRARTARTA